MAPRPLTALLRRAPLPAPDADVWRTVVTPWPATLTDRATGAPLARAQWLAARDAMLQLFEERADRYRQFGFPGDRMPANQATRITEALRVADEAALIDACTRVLAIEHGRYTHDLASGIDPVITHAIRAALAEGRLWTPLLECLYRRPSADTFPLSYATRTSDAWMRRIERWLATAARPQVEALLASQAPPLLDRIALAAPLGAWPLVDRWRLAVLGPHGTCRDLWQNPSWTLAERTAFLADALDRLTTRQGLPGALGATVPRARQETLLLEMLQIGWESTETYDLTDPSWTTRWLALLATGVLDTMDVGYHMGRVLFQATATPAAVIAGAIARWQGTSQEDPGTWAANAHTPLAYVRDVLEHPGRDTGGLFRCAARHPGAVRDPDLRARLLASRSKLIWHLLWPHTPEGERGPYLAQFLKVAPLEALQALVADPTARTLITPEMVIPLFTHGDAAIREAAFQVIEHLQPGVHQPTPLPKLAIIRRPPRRSSAP